jgi:hypothetical protein
VTGSFQQPPQKERNRDVCPGNWSGLSDHWPSPGVNPTIYPSSLPRALGKLTGNILPKDIKFFSFQIETRLIDEMFVSVMGEYVFLK